MNQLALEVEGLVKVYHLRGAAPIRAVDGMSFTVSRGKIFGLLGPNGAGKTTLLKMLSTRTRPTDGRARVMGWVHQKRNREVGLHATVRRKNR